MTVGELIELLQRYDQDKQVYYENNELECASIKNVNQYNDHMIIMS